MAKTLDVKVPDIGDNHDVPVIELLVNEGDRIEKDQPLLVLESDKATMEIPSSDAGVVRSLKVKTGDKLNQGDVICQLEIEGDEQTAAPASKPADTPQVAQAAAAAPKPREPEPSAAPAPAAATSEGGAAQRSEVRVPDIGDYHDVPVIEVLVQDGDEVAHDQPLLVLESDKATMEIPAPAAGTVRGFRLKVGDKVNRGDVLCTLEGRAVAAPERPAPQTPKPDAARQEAPKKQEGARAEETPSAPPSAPAKAPPPPTSAAPKSAGELPYAGPATRKFARELGVDLTQLKGSGARGRILIEDVQAFVKQRLQQAAPAAGAAAAVGNGIPPIPAQDFSAFGPIEQKPLARIRKLSASHLHRSWLNVPHVTQHDDADITELEAFRKSLGEELGTKLTLLPFFMKACAALLRQYPEFNSSLAPEGDSLILKGYCHIGFAADTPNGLVVPVVRDVWDKGIVQLGQECAELAKKARDGKLKPDEMRGGCFSISSLGGIGGSYFTPIVNAPEVAILGVSRAVMKPHWDGNAFVPRLMCPLSLSYDHRVIDGAAAARFIVALGKLLADLRRLSL